MNAAVSPARLGPAADERTDTLLRAAAEGIAERGYDTVRLRDIARACGVTTGTVQYYFDSRERLLTEAFALAAHEQVEVWRRMAAGESEPWARVRALLRQVGGDETSVQQCVIWTELAACASRHAHLRSLYTQIYREWQTLLLDAIDSGVRDGVFHPIMETRDVVNAIVAMIDGVEAAIASQSGVLDPLPAQQLVFRVSARLVGIGGADG